MTRFIIAIVLGFAIQLAGCSALSLNPLASTNNSSSAPPIPEKDVVGECQVNYRWGSGKTETRMVSLQAESTVQQVLAKSNGERKFSRMEIILARPLPNGAWHKMEVDYNRSARKVEASNDYSVQPGDRLLVKEVNKTLIDDMVESTLGPAGKSLGSRMLK